jgi:hypothetical protein
VFGAVDVFDFLAKIVAHVLSWMFVIGVAGTVLLAIPVAAYQLFSVLFENGSPRRKRTPSTVSAVVIRNSQASEQIERPKSVDSVKVDGATMLDEEWTKALADGRRVKFTYRHVLVNGSLRLGLSGLVLLGPWAPAEVTRAIRAITS